MPDALVDPIAAQRQFLISVSGVSGVFATRRGGETTAETSKEFDGGSLEAEVLAAPPLHGDVTVTRPFRPARDAELIRRLRPLVSRWRTNVIAQPTDRDLTPIGKPTTYSGLLTGVNDPEADAKSGDAATVELTFTIERIV